MSLSRQWKIESGGRYEGTQMGNYILTLVLHAFDVTWSLLGTGDLNLRESLMAIKQISSKRMVCLVEN